MGNGTMALARHKPSRSLQTQSVFGTSETFRRGLETFKNSKERLQETEQLIRDVVDPSKQAQVKYKLARLVQAIIPRKLQFMIPEGLSKLLAENLDPLQKIDTIFRFDINTSQDSAADMIAEIKKAKQELEQFKERVLKAEQENWDVKTLQQYVASRNNLPIRKEVLEVLEERLGLLSPEDIESQRKMILSSLKADIKNSEGAEELRKEIVLALVETVSHANLGYNSFANVLKPTIAMRDAANNITDLRGIMNIAGGAILMTIDTTVGGFEEVIDSLERAENNRIASVDTLNQLREGRQRIVGKLAGLRNTTRSMNEQILDAEFEDVTPQS